MRVAIDDGNQAECSKISIHLRIGSSGMIPVEDDPIEGVYHGDELVISIERDEPTNIPVIKDFQITVRLTRFDGEVVSRTMNSTKLVELVRDHIQEDA